MIFGDEYYDYYQPGAEEEPKPAPAPTYQPVAATMPINPVAERKGWVPEINFGAINWEAMVRWAIVLCGVGVLATVTALRPKTPSTALLNTSASSEAKEMEMRQAAAVVLGKHVQIGDQEILVSDPRKKHDAAERILDWQDDELLQDYVNRLNLQILQGIANATHSCYQKSVAECVGLLRKQNDQNWQLAADKRDHMQMMAATLQDKALNKVERGDTTPAKFEPSLTLVARAQLRSASKALEALSPDGLADQLLERVEAK